MRNLEYPLNWDEIFAYVGFPLFMKPHDGGGWRDVYKLHTPEELYYHYNQSGSQCMMLQEAVEYEAYYRCYCVGKRDVHVMPYAPHHPMHLRYMVEYHNQPAALFERLRSDTLAVNTALGYDLNTVEFAVRGGVPYAIDYMNPAPDCDLYSVGPDNFEWVVDAVARLALDCAREERKNSMYLEKAVAS